MPLFIFLLRLAIRFWLYTSRFKISFKPKAVPREPDQDLLNPGTDLIKEFDLLEEIVREREEEKRRHFKVPQTWLDQMAAEETTVREPKWFTPEQFRYRGPPLPPFLIENQSNVLEVETRPPN